jgi:hypothetical protein
VAATAAPHRLAPGSLAALAADNSGQAPRATSKAAAAGGLSGGSASARAIVSTAGPVTKQQQAQLQEPANATPTASAPRALQLVRLNPRTGQMEVGAEALAALRACKGPVGVVAVAGRARSGKSYVLNAILRRAAAAASGGGGGGDGNSGGAPSNTNADEACCAPGGFALAHSYRPCTKGLWLWSSPVGPIDSLTGEQAPAEAAAGGGRQQRPRQPVGGATDPHNHHHLVLLDTEGIDAYDQTTTDGVRIFALAVLLSSLFVFNQFGAIDEAALDRLSLVTELTRHIRVRAKGGGGGGGEGKCRKNKEGQENSDDEEDDEDEDEERRRNMRALGAVNPRLLWLLRDFYFDLDDDLDEEEEDDEEDEYEEEHQQQRGRGSGAAAAASSSAPCGPGDVRASATFEPGRWPPPPPPVREEEDHEEDDHSAALRSRRHHRAAAHRSRPRTTPGDYLEAALAPAPQRGGGGGGGHASSSASAAALAAKNAVRQSIKALFPDRDCFTLVRPVTDERALRKLDALPASALRPEFRRGVARLARLVLERAGPKTVHGHVVTGPVLAGLAEAYVAAINAGAVPTIATAWEGVAERECRRAAREAEDAYVAAFGAAASSSSSPAAPPPLLNEPELLEAEHRRALAIARRVFAEEAVGGGGGGGDEGGEGDDEDAAASSSSLSAREAARRQLEAALDRRFSLVRARALADADAHAERMLAEGRQQVSAAARLGRGGWRDVSAAVADVERRYGAEAGGTAKWPRLLSFVREAYDSAGHEVAERLKSAAEARIERAELAAREAKTEAGEQRLRADAAEAALLAERERRSAAEQERERREREREQQYSAYGAGGGGGSGNGLLAWLGCFGGGGGGGRY